MNDNYKLIYKNEIKKQSSYKIHKNSLDARLKLVKIILQY